MSRAVTLRFRQKTNSVSKLQGYVQYLEPYDSSALMVFHRPSRRTGLGVELLPQQCQRLLYA